MPALHQEPQKSRARPARHLPSLTMETQMCDTLFKVPDAAARLGVSVRKFYMLLDAGKINAVKLDGCTRIKESELARYIQTLPGMKATVAA